MEQKVSVLNTKEDADNILYKLPYLAFLDVLGFKELVKGNTHETLTDLYEKLFLTQVERTAEKQRAYAKSRSEKLGKNYTDSNLQFMSISDSILIWSEHGQPSALFEIVFAVSSLLGISMIQGLPLRGCITRQKFSVMSRTNTFSILGRGLIHAYDMERKQQWSGCVIDPEIINYFRSIEKIIFNRDIPSQVETDKLVFEYDIPFKCKNASGICREKGYAINWSANVITDDIIRDAFNAHNKKDDKLDSNTPLKINETIRFHNFCLGKTDPKLSECS
jgi:hypothetical protein